MKRASGWAREFASGVADMEFRRSRPAEVMGNVIGFALVFGVFASILYGLLLDCGGSAC